MSAKENEIPEPPKAEPIAYLKQDGTLVVPEGSPLKERLAEFKMYAGLEIMLPLYDGLHLNDLWNDGFSKGWEAATKA